MFQVLFVLFFLLLWIGVGNYETASEYSDGITPQWVALFTAVGFTVLAMAVRVGGRPKRHCRRIAGVLTVCSALSITMAYLIGLTAGFVNPGFAVASVLVIPVSLFAAIVVTHYSRVIFYLSSIFSTVIISFTLLLSAT